MDDDPDDSTRVLMRALRDMNWLEAYAPPNPVGGRGPAHWLHRGYGETHQRIHHMAEEAMSELGESPIEGRVDIICDAVYIGSQLLLEEKLPWIAP